MGMLRSHRLLRFAHNLRLGRMVRARSIFGFDVCREVQGSASFMKELEKDAYVDLRAMVVDALGSPAAIAARVAAELDRQQEAGSVAKLLAQAAFADRRDEAGRYRTGGSDRVGAEGAFALAEAALLDRVFRAASEAARRRLLLDHRERPSWPEAYAHRREEPVRTFGLPIRLRTFGCGDGPLRPDLGRLTGSGDFSCVRRGGRCLGRWPQFSFFGFRMSSIIIALRVIT